MSNEPAENDSEQIIPKSINVANGGDLENLRSTVERRLQQVYGSGTYLTDFYVADSGTLAISIGNTFPKDVSDCRPNRNRVIKYISLDDIAELYGERNENQYEIQLPSRASVEEGFIEEQKNLRNELDQAMARATYEKIATTPAVENQLNPIKQILRWTRLYQPVPFEEVRKAQNKDGDKTLKYVHTLEELGFIEYREEKLFPKRRLEKYDLGEVQGKEFNKKILGEVIEQGFQRLSRDLQLGILRHLPKFANGYYVASLEVNNPDLHLDMDAIQENMIEWYGPSARYHRFELRDKLSFLVQNEILERKGNEEDESELYFKANQTVYNEMSATASL